MKRLVSAVFVLLASIVFFVPGCFSSEHLSQEPVLSGGEKTEDRLELHGDLWVYGLWLRHPYHSPTQESSFLETTARLTADLRVTDQLSATVRIVGAGTAGDDEELTGWDDEWTFDADLGYLTLKEPCEWPVTFMLGLQRLHYGTGLLIHDGWSDNEAVWIGPFKSFYALRSVVTLGKCVWDSVVAWTRSSFRVNDLWWNSYKGRNKLYATFLKYEGEGCLGEFGLLYRDDTSELQQDTFAATLRGEYQFETFPRWKTSGELVKQYGDTHLAGAEIGDGDFDRDSWGGHVDLTYRREDLKWSPYLMVSGMYFQGDDKDTEENEGYDPLFYGFDDWGRWFIGDIHSWSLPLTNQCTVMLEAGITPTESTSFRLQYFNIRLDEDVYDAGSKKWGDEWDLIFDWDYNDHLVFGVMLGYARASSAAEFVNGGDKDSYEVIAWTELSF